MIFKDGFQVLRENSVGEMVPDVQQVNIWIEMLLLNSEDLDDLKK